VDVLIQRHLQNDEDRAVWCSLFSAVEVAGDGSDQKSQGLRILRSIDSRCKCSTRLQDLVDLIEMQLVAPEVQKALDKEKLGETAPESEKSVQSSCLVEFIVQNRLKAMTDFEVIEEVLGHVCAMSYYGSCFY